MYDALTQSNLFALVMVLGPLAIEVCPLGVTITLLVFFLQKRQSMIQVIANTKTIMNPLTTKNCLSISFSYALKFS